jgi:hypothetical protein
MLTLSAGDGYHLYFEQGHWRGSRCIPKATSAGRLSLAVLYRTRSDRVSR